MTGALRPFDMDEPSGETLFATNAVANDLLLLVDPDIQRPNMTPFLWFQYF